MFHTIQATWQYVLETTRMNALLVDLDFTGRFTLWAVLDWHRQDCTHASVL
jgi:hypothetical protein